MADTTSVTPPVAAKKPSNVTHHGITLTDEYAWLRDPGYPQVTNREVLSHLEAENAWFEARMAPHKGLADDLFSELRGRIKEADKSVPQKDGDFLYWIEFEDGAEYKKWWRRPVGAADDGSADRLILDEVALAAGKHYFRLGAISASNDGKLLAFSVDDNGSERFTARIVDLETGTLLPGRDSRHAVLAGLGRRRYRVDLFAGERELAHRQCPAALAGAGQRHRYRAVSRARRRVPRRQFVIREREMGDRLGKRSRDQRSAPDPRGRSDYAADPCPPPRKGHRIRHRRARWHAVYPCQ